MDFSQLKPIVEAMIFVAEEPIGEKDLLEVLAQDGVDRDALGECLMAIERDWNGNAERGIGLCRVAGGYQFRTKQGYADWLKRLNVPRPMRLSGPALETLTIVAYRQPIVRSEIEKIRGVDSGGVLKTLLERRLLRIVGRRDEPGQPLLYGTTKEFLEVFNLNSLSELPTLKDIDDLMRERRAVTEEKKAPPGNGEGEDATEPIEAEGEEADIIRCRPLDGDEEEEHKDMDALSSLEDSLKGLRRLERQIFPKPKPTQGEGQDTGQHGDEHPSDSNKPAGQEGAAAGASGTSGDGAAEDDAPGADDSARE